MKKLLTKVIVIALMLAGAISAVIPTGMSYAAPEHYDPCDPNLGPAVLEANNCPGTSEYTDNDVGNVVVSIGNAIIGIASVVAVIVIVIGGVRYVTSAGDAGKLEKAKSTILYAVISLIVCALAAVLVNFVVKAIVKSQNSASSYTTKIDCESAGWTWNDGQCP